MVNQLHIVAMSVMISDAQSLKYLVLKNGSVDDECVRFCCWLIAVIDFDDIG